MLHVPEMMLWLPASCTPLPRAQAMKSQSPPTTGVPPEAPFPPPLGRRACRSPRRSCAGAEASGRPRGFRMPRDLRVVVALVHVQQTGIACIREVPVRRPCQVVVHPVLGAEHPADLIVEIASIVPQPPKLRHRLTRPGVVTGLRVAGDAVPGPGVDDELCAAVHGGERVAHECAGASRGYRPAPWPLAPMPATSEASMPELRSASRITEAALRHCPCMSISLASP